MKLLVFAVLVTVVAADLTNFPHFHGGFYEHPTSAYQFAYSFQNNPLNRPPIGDFIGAPVSGSYYVVLPDGRIQILYYR